MDMREAVRKRQAVRAFRPDPVPAPLVRSLIEEARQAPSGGNLQPWRVYALMGRPLEDFKALVAARLDAGEREAAEYEIYPKDLWEPFRARRRAAGAQRYGALGIGRADNGQAHLERLNFRFFGAPVGLFFCLDRRLGPPQWADLGMYMQTLMLLAVGEGLSTCPQEVWANWPKTIGTFLDLGEDQMVFAGMSLGYADEASPMNGYRTAREPVETFATILGAEEA
jgi:nitroreductase